MTVFQIPLTVYPEGVRLRADKGKRILPNIFRGALYTMNTKTKKILLWALSAFLFLTFFAALAQGVFAAAVFALIAGLSCNPLVQDVLKPYSLPKYTMPVVFGVSFLLCTCIFPKAGREASDIGQTTEIAVQAKPSATVSIAETESAFPETVTLASETEPSQTQAPAESETAPDRTSVPELTTATPVRSEAAAPPQTAAPTLPAQTVPVRQPVEQTVWLSATGEKYHNKPNCGNMNPDKARKVSLSQALAEGRQPCKKCFG